MQNVNCDWKDLVHRALKNDQGAVAELIGLTQKDLFSFCYHLSKNRQLAEDITHDSYIKALSSLSQLKEPTSFVPWIKKIARSLYLDYLKAAANSKEHIDLSDLSNQDMPAQDPAVSAEQMSAMHVLQMLEESDRVILILIDIQECSYQDVSQILSIPEGTVKSRLFRAREKFAKIYNGHGTNQAADSSIQKAGKKA